MTKAMHDVFELASGQKSNRDSATEEGLIGTTMAAVRVLRKAAEEHKEGRELAKRICLKLTAQTETIAKERDQLREALHRAAEEADRRIRIIAMERDAMREALERIASYPVHSEPVGGALEMQDIAAKVLEGQ